MHSTQESVDVAGVRPIPGSHSPAAAPPEPKTKPAPAPEPRSSKAPSPQATVAAQSTVAIAMLKSHELAEERRRLLEAETRLLDLERQESLARERELARFD